MNKNLKHLNAVVTKATTSPNNNLPDPIKQKNIGSMLSKLNGVDIDSAQKSKNIGTEYNEDFIDEDWLSYTDSSINLDEYAPIITPIITKGTHLLVKSQSIPPFLLCALADIIEVTTIVDNDVPIDKGIAISISIPI